MYPFALSHLRLTLVQSVLGRTGDGDQGGIPRRAILQHQPPVTQQRVEGGQDQRGQLVLPQHVAEAQDGALVEQPVIPAAQTRETAAHRATLRPWFRVTTPAAETGMA